MRRRDAWPEGDSGAPSQPSRPAAVLPVAQGDQLFDALAEERAGGDVHLPECEGWPFVVVRTLEAGGGAQLPARDSADHRGGCDIAGGVPGVHAHHEATGPHRGLEEHGCAAADVGGW